jgi:hypothetical protein
MRRLGGNPRSNICVFFLFLASFLTNFVRQASRGRKVCAAGVRALYVWKKLEKMALSSTCFLVVHAPLYTTPTNQALASRRAFSMLYTALHDDNRTCDTFNDYVLDNQAGLKDSFI